MTGTRKREETQGAAWLTVMLDLLRGGALGAVVALAVLGIAAVLVWAGLLASGRGDSAVIAGCLLGGLAGGAFAVGRTKRAALPVGLGAGGVLFLLLLTAGVLLYDAMPSLRSGGVVACACLCGGGLAGVLRSRPKKRRKK